MYEAARRREQIYQGSEPYLQINCLGFSYLCGKEGIPGRDINVMEWSIN
jgi:hypothetical protein